MTTAAGAQHPKDALGPTLARGALSGLAGVTVMTAWQKLVEMPITGREDSFEPANLLLRVLPIAPKHGAAKRRLNYAAHFGVGLGWGAAHAAITRRTGHRGPARRRDRVRDALAGRRHDDGRARAQPAPVALVAPGPGDRPRRQARARADDGRGVRPASRRQGRRG
jgi:hypothetical protein